jgi:hypothetical protein
MLAEIKAEKAHAAEKERAAEVERKRLVAEEEARIAAAKPKAAEAPPAQAQARQEAPAAGAPQSSPAPEAAQAAPPAQRQAAKPKLPKSPLQTKRATDWPAFIEDLLAAIKADDGNGVAVYNHFAAEIEFCRDARTKDHDRVMAAMDAKRLK